MQQVGRVLLKHFDSLNVPVGSSLAGAVNDGPCPEKPAHFTHGLGQGIQVGQKLDDLLLEDVDAASQDAECPLGGRPSGRGAGMVGERHRP